MMQHTCLLDARVYVVFWCFYYRPQRSWAKVMFLQASVILLTGGGVCLSACWDTPSPRADTPGADTHHPWSKHHPGADTPWEQTPPGADTPPGSRHPTGSRDPPLEADSGIRSTSGQYASYWNAFLFYGQCLWSFGEYPKWSSPLEGPNLDVCVCVGGWSQIWNQRYINQRWDIWWAFCGNVEFWPIFTIHNEVAVR